MDDIAIEPGKVVPLVAAATLLQLDNLIQRCVEVMTEHLNVDTAISYLEAAQKYALVEFGVEGKDWMLRNLIHYANDSIDFLRSIRFSISSS